MLQDLYTNRNKVQLKINELSKLSRLIASEILISSSITDSGYSVDDVSDPQKQIYNRNLQAKKNKSYIDNVLIPRLKSSLSELNQSIDDEIQKSSAV